MHSDTDQAIIIPFPDPVLGRSIDQLEQVGGDELISTVTGADVQPAIDDFWLDELADGLSESAWMELDLTPRLPAGLLAALRNEVATLDKAEAMSRAGIGRGRDLVKDRSVRRDKIAWMDGYSEPQRLLFECLEQIREGLNRRLYLGLKRFEAHYATYHPGDFYKRHLDSFRGRASRVVSLVLYLNEDWGLEDGAELRVFSAADSGQMVGQVRPEAGRAVLFLSEQVPHEVLPARRTRYSIACWLRQDEVPLPL